jgi:hypothetical protein
MRHVRALPTTVEEMVRRLETLVSSSPFVLLLQTRCVLSQPWALLTAYCAALTRTPITCVLVNNSGYDFGDATKHLEHLSERLEAASLEQLTNVLSQLSPPRTVTDLQEMLTSRIPHIISVDPAGSDNESIRRGATMSWLRRYVTFATSRPFSPEAERVGSPSAILINQRAA